MSERKEIIRGLVLSFRDEVDISYAHKAVHNLLTSLRYKAPKSDWKYWLIGVGSCIDADTKEPARTHVHIYIEAFPGSTVVDWIKDYWVPRNGIVKVKPVDGHPNLIEYFFRQASFHFQQGY